MQTTPNRDKTFPKNDHVDCEKITFRNRYGIVLTGDLYLPKNRDGKKLPALTVCGPYGAVKEQSSGLYAQMMAAQGFVALAFDPSFTGESSGSPRHVPSPDINTEDFSASVDFLGLHPSVDRNRIGLIGICGWSSLGLSAAAADKRIKAAVTASMYDMSRVMAHGMNDSMTKAQRAETQEKFSLQRWNDAEAGNPELGPRILPETLNEDADPVTKEFFEYYRTPRGFHKNSPNSTGSWIATAPMPFMNFPLLTYLDEISPRPILLIAGENAHSRYFSEDAYKQAAEPKRLLIIENANHVDLYDQKDKIPFDEIVSFFQSSLN